MPTTLESKYKERAKVAHLRAGVPHDYVAMLFTPRDLTEPVDEKGERAISFEDLERYARAGIDTHYIITGEWHTPPQDTAE